ncbi:NAD_binding_11 domain-containing protein [Psidium guajava]|nr:NAD_binding_11 domain-containing protein [Psidium guajava]
MCLADWAWRHVQDGKPISDAIDKELNKDLCLDEISKVFKLGIFCTETQPSRRPTMKEVLHVLLNCSNPLYDVKKKSCHMSNVAPLLGNSKDEKKLRSDYYVLECNTY